MEIPKTINEFLELATKSEMMPDYDKIQFKDNVNIEELRKLSIMVMKENWKARQLLNLCADLLSGGVVLENGEVVTYKEVVNRIDKLIN